MSSAPAPLQSSAASSEQFAQPPSVNHGVSGHLPQGIFQTLQLDRERGHDVDHPRWDGQSRKNGENVLNPFAKEFVPGGRNVPGRPTVTNGELQLKHDGGRRKGSNNGSSWRSNGSQDGTRSISVRPRDEAKRNHFAHNTAGTSMGRSNGSVNTAPRKENSGRQNQRAFHPARFDTSSPAVRAQAGERSSTNAPWNVGNTRPANRRGQGSNANHLLNFQYDPISRPPPRAPPARRQRKIQPFNKELFLQANFRFLVSDLGDYMLNTADPDKMLQWEDVAAVNVAAPVPVQCPICLDSPPLCPQITTCGHIFCFPCVLRYLLMGDLDSRGDHWKKCPLCFAMICSKELRTVLIDDVEQKGVGDMVKFTLLMRAKGSIIPFERREMVSGPLAFSKDGQCHHFSKFTLTSDAEPTTNKAVNELTEWAQRAEVEGGEDLDLLPYVFVAIDQLQQRKSAWTDHRASEFLSSSPPVRQRIMAQAKVGVAKPVGSSSAPSSQKTGLSEGNLHADNMKSLSRALLQGKLESEEDDVGAKTEAAMAELKERAGWVYESAFSDDEEEDDLRDKVKSHVSENIGGNTHAKGKLYRGSVHNTVDVGEESPEDPDSEDTNLLDYGGKKDRDTKRETEERDAFTFYQSADGQSLILHPLNVKCLLHHYGSYEALPDSLEAEVVELETVTQTEATRKRYRYLSHLPLTAVFQLCEVDLSRLMPSKAFVPFAEEIRSREMRRRRVLKQEQAQKALEEKSAAAKAARNTPPSPADFTALMTSLQVDEGFTSADFEDSLVSSPVTSSSPPEVEDRRLFSRVAKLGFAAGYDAPDLIAKKSEAVTSSVITPATAPAWTGASSAEAGSSASHGLSFADIIQAQAAKAAQEEPASGGIRSGTKKGHRVVRFSCLVTS
ncbi:hypothetical protein R1flu_007516 [Riccia fluitans]|uniref:RING-type domain-containing protein n=1 Tax=Riccia fluitans TaxID=41844 RepID=A0ABD1Z380_9MARC